MPGHVVDTISDKRCWQDFEVSTVKGQIFSLYCAW